MKRREYDVDDPRHPDYDGGLKEAFTIIRWVFGLVFGIPALIGGVILIVVTLL